MADHLPVPPELQHLIEKRENHERRRRARRSDGDRRDSDLGPLGGKEPIEHVDQLPLADRRLGAERREDGERRKEVRRKADADPPGAPEQESPNAPSSQ